MTQIKTVFVRIDCAQEFFSNRLLIEVVTNMERHTIEQPIFPDELESRFDQIMGLATKTLKEAMKRKESNVSNPNQQTVNYHATRPIRHTG